MLFIDFSSAFNALILVKFIHKIKSPCLNDAICKRISPADHRKSNLMTDTDELCASTGVPQGGTFRPLLFPLQTSDRVATSSKTSIVQYADDTTIVGLISSNDGSHHRAEEGNVVRRSQENYLVLN